MSCRLSSVVTAAPALLLLIALPAAAQNRLSILPTDGQGAFLTAYNSKKPHFGQINRANEGEKASKESKEDQEAINVVAKYHTYRITWDSFKEPGATTSRDLTDPGVVNSLMKEFELQVKAAEDAQKGNPVFTEMYLKALALRARDVVQTSKPISAVNAGHMLARLAEAGSDDAGDACLEAIKDEKDFLEPRTKPACSTTHCRD